MIYSMDYISSCFPRSCIECVDHHININILFLAVRLMACTYICVCIIAVKTVVPSVYSIILKLLTTNCQFTSFMGLVIDISCIFDCD